MKLENKKKKNFFQNFTKKQNFVGFINITNNGYAFVNVNEFNQDIFIPKNKINRSLEGDLVQVKLLKKSGKKIKGEIIKIIKRKRKKFIGILKIKSNYKYGSVIFPKKTIHVDIYIPQKKLKQFHHNEKVLVKITKWPKNFKNPLGEIIKVFGLSGEHQTEVFSLLEEYGISYKFSKKVEKEAQKILLTNNLDTSFRKDLRKINTFTIDPIDAEDFDDALSIKKLNNNIWEIGVHISDVTHYVKEGSSLDKEAYTRASSIYLEGKVIPMLPNQLSNNLCSLLPKKDKLSFSSIFNMNKKGQILKSWFGKTIIQSNKKFTYEEVQNIIDKKKGDYYEDISTLFFFSKILNKNRLKNGALFLERLEVKFDLDEKKNPTKLYLKKNNDAHHLIEEFMLLTNRKISEFVNLHLDKKPNQRLYIYRIHDKPDLKKIMDLNKIIKPLGYYLDKKNFKQSINFLLKEIKKKPEKNFIENLILRVMSKAKYSTENIGHYGLSFIYYTHFTSPIRRYSDIIAHRLLNNYLILKKNNTSKKLKEFYEKQSQYCSYKERLSIDIERDFLKFLQIKYIKKYIGKKFNGIITGFTDWSIYVDLFVFQTEGMIRLRDIQEDVYILQSKTSIIGKKKRKIYHLGDKIKVKLINVNIEKKQITLNFLK